MTVQSYKTLSLACVQLIAVVIFQSLNDAKCVNQLINQHNNGLRGIVYNERTNDLCTDNQDINLFNAC